MAAVHVGAALLLDEPLSNGFARWAVASGAATVVGVLIETWSCDLLFGWRPTWLYASVIAGSGL